MCKEPLLIHRMTGFCILLLLWQAGDNIGLGHPTYFVGPDLVLSRGMELLISESFYCDSTATMLRCALAVFWSGIIAIPCGILLGHHRRSYIYFSGVLDMFRSIPPIAIYPLLLVLLGPNDSARIAAAALGAGTVMLLIISRTVHEHSKRRQNFFRVLGASSAQIFFHIVCFEALPGILVALRTATSLALIFVVATEMVVGATHGLGTRVMNVQISADIPDFYFTCLTIGIIGTLCNSLFAAIEKQVRKYVLQRNLLTAQ